MQVKSYFLGQWRAGKGPVQALRDAATGELVAELMPATIDGRAVLDYGRDKGGAALRALTFHERAGLLKALAKQLSEHKEKLYSLSYATGATRADSGLDIEGGLGVLFSYASRALRELPNAHILVDGPSEPLSKTGEFLGQHIFASRRGVAVQINAFNFPVWGMLEKFAPALLAGVPSVVKPASVTSFLTAQAVGTMLDSGILPEGSLQFIAGGVGDLLEHVTYQDSISFTGSGATALRIRSQPSVISSAARFMAETDSLNACVLGPDAAPGTAEFDLFAQEVVREMTCKAGQRCTAIRRAIVPRAFLASMAEVLQHSLSAVVVGDPRRADVAMGPLVELAQRRAVLANVSELAAEADRLTGAAGTADIVGADAEKGGFVMPTLLLCRQPTSSRAVHEVEVFGPVCTLMPYDSVSEAVAIAARGGGSLVSSIFSADVDFARGLVSELAPYHGRVLVVDRITAKHSSGHGSPLPGLVHGGPGRAGGGEELGGMRAVLHHMQRTAVQSAADLSTRWTRV